MKKSIYKIAAILLTVLFAAPLFADPAGGTDPSAGPDPRGGSGLVKDTDKESADNLLRVGDDASSGDTDDIDTQNNSDAVKTDTSADTDVSDTEDIAEASKEAEKTVLKSEIKSENMPKLQVELEPATVSIGQQAVWKIKVVENKNSCRVIVSNPSFSNLELTGAYNKEDVEGDDKKVREYPDDITYAASLISFDEGEYKIAPQKITVVDKDGNISEILTGEKTLKVKSLIANEPEPKIKEDKGKGEVVIEKDNTFIYIFVGLISVILIVLLTLLGRKLWQMRKPAPAAPPPPPRPAEVIAFEKLNGLKNSQYLNEDKHKEFHLKLSESIREYLGNRYHFDSLEKSTFELIGLIKNNKIKREIFLEIVKLLEDTDLVKFAKYIPDVGESRELLEDAFRIVNITTEEAMALKNRTSLENSDDSKPQSVPGGDV